MKTGLTKREKTTDIFFDVAGAYITVCTHKTDLKNRLSSYAAACFNVHPGRFPVFDILYITTNRFSLSAVLFYS